MHLFSATNSVYGVKDMHKFNAGRSPAVDKKFNRAYQKCTRSSRRNREYYVNHPPFISSCIFFPRGAINGAGLGREGDRKGEDESTRLLVRDCLMLITCWESLPRPTPHRGVCWKEGHGNIEDFLKVCSSIQL